MRPACAVIQIDRMRIRMIANLVTFGEHALSDSRKALDLTTDHEKRSGHVVLTENLENSFRISRWSIVERQRHCTSVPTSMPLCLAEPLRAHGISGVIAGQATRNRQHPASYQW